MGEQIFAEAGLGAPESVEKLQQRIVRLEQNTADMKLNLNEAAQDLKAAG